MNSRRSTSPRSLRDDTRSDAQGTRDRPGERVKINGSDFNINGEGGEGGAGPQQLALVE